MNLLKKQSVSNNFFFQILYQIWMLVIPLIISPYLTRTLGERSLGIYTYVNTIAYYFILFANLGISRYGQRAISECRDVHSLRKAFWGLLTIHNLFSAASLLAYVCFSSFVIKEHQDIYLIESIYVLSAMFDVTWLFYGLENFKSVAIRNFIIKAVELILVFWWVKSPRDVGIYALITAMAWVIGQLSMFFQAIIILHPIKLKKADIIPHIKPLLVFFISVVAISLYTVFDKTLLGILSTKENVAYYEYANKIIVIPRTFIAVIGTVLYPRACRVAAENNLEKQRKYLDISLTITAFIGVGSMFGLLAISKLLAQIYYGPTFIQSGYIMMSMSALPFICGLGEIVRAQYMIPNKMDKQYVGCIVINAVINLVISSALIPILGVYGAVIGTLSAEVFGTIVQIYLCRNFVKPRMILVRVWPFVFIGLIMYIGVWCVGRICNQNWLGLVVQISTGVVVYSLGSLVYLYFGNREYFNALTNLLRKRRRD